MRQIIHIHFHKWYINIHSCNVSSFRCTNDTWHHHVFDWYCWWTGVLFFCVMYLGSSISTVLNFYLAASIFKRNIRYKSADLFCLGVRSFAFLVYIDFPFCICCISFRTTSTTSITNSSFYIVPLHCSIDQLAYDYNIEKVLISVSFMVFIRLVLECDIFL